MKNERPPKWDHNRMQFLMFGMCVGLFLSTILLNYTSYGYELLYEDTGYQPEEDETVPVRTHAPKKIKKLKPPKIEKAETIEFVPEEPEVEYVDELPLEVEDAIIGDEDIDPVMPKEEPKKVAAPAPPPPPEKDLNVPVIRAQRMPTLSNCRNLSSESERNDCTNDELMAYVYKNLKYPTLAREIGIEGMVIARFIVNKDGGVEDIKIMRDIGGGCGDAVINVLQKMPSWEPGLQNGRKVKVIYNIPVKFGLIKR